MKTIEIDDLTKMKLGTDGINYFIWMFNNKWVLINVNEFKQALKLFHKVSSEHYIDELKRTNNVLFG